MLKSLNSKPGDLAAKFISIDGKPMMARRSVTYTQPLRDESDKPNVEQPSQHDDCDTMENAGSQQSQSYVNVVNSESPKKKVNFRTLVNDECVKDADFVLPLDTIAKVKHRFANSLVGFFVGKSVAFQLNTPIILNKWTPNLSLTKDEVTNVPVWVKMHKVPVVAYSEDGLSLIATQIGKPVMLDASTSSMCMELWGHIGFPRALIEVSTDEELKQDVIMVVPLEDAKKPEVVVVQNDGFTIVSNRRKKGKKQDQPRVIEGLKLHKPKSSFVYRPKNIQPASKSNNDEPLNVTNLKNHFDDTESDSEVEETVIKNVSTIKRASTPSNDGFFALGIGRRMLISAPKGFISLGIKKPKGGAGLLKKLDRIWVVTKMKSLKTPLRMLLCDHENLHDRVVKLRHELDEVQKAMDLNPTDSNLRDEEVVYVKAFTEAKIDEERFLKQKSKVEWLDVGDSNSAYFYKSVKSRNQRSRIKVIKDANNVEDAMFDIGDDKAPGPDGFNAAFFKKSWDKVGIKEVVSENQSAFVLGRLITDNILITQELMHHYHRNRGPPRCAFKVDIQKAYDTVD
nr:hypothetical protein [Tanacetum cinerariifolium]